MDEVSMEKKKQQKGLLIGGIVVVLFLIIGTFAAYFLPTKPKKVFTTAIESVYSLSKENSKQSDKLGGTFTLSTDLHSDNKQEEKIFEILNNLNIKIDYQVDTNAKKMQMLLDSHYKDKELLAASMNIENDNAYIFLKDIYSKYLLVPSEGLDKMFKTFENTKDYEIVLKYFKNAFKKSLKDEYFTKENTSISLNGKNVKVSKNNLVLNEKNITEIANVLSEELNNKEFIESCSRITDTSEEKIRNGLEELKENVDIEETLIVTIYTQGLQNKFAGISFQDENEKFSIFKNTETNYSYEVTANRQNFKGDIEIKVSNKKDANIKLSFDIDGIKGFITFDFVSNENVDFNKIDENNVVSTENLSNQEAMQIINNFQKKEGIADFIKAITSLYSSNFSF